MCVCENVFGCVFFGGNYRLDKFVLTTWRVCKFFISIVFCFKRRTDKKPSCSNSKEHRRILLARQTWCKNKIKHRYNSSSPSLLFCLFVRSFSYFSCEITIVRIFELRSSSIRYHLYIRIASNTPFSVDRFFSSVVGADSSKWARECAHPSACKRTIYATRKTHNRRIEK